MMLRRQNGLEDFLVVSQLQVPTSTARLSIRHQLFHVMHLKVEGSNHLCSLSSGLGYDACL